VPGATGPPGSTGPAGPTGERGPTGATGPAGAAGVSASQIITGLRDPSTSSADCPNEAFLLGGGFELVGVGGEPPNPDDDVLKSRPSPSGTGWEAELLPIAEETEVVAYAVCSVPAHGEPR
jgi:hypothetical protein